MNRPLDYETPPDPPARSFWNLTRQQAASMVAFVVPFTVAYVFSRFTDWPWWIVLPLGVALVVTAELLALRLVRRTKG